MQISKYKVNAILTIAFVATLLTPLIGLRHVASAVTDTCTWIGGTDLNFNTAANWSCSIDGATIPENGDTLEFDVSTLSANETLNNDIVGLSVAGINRVGDSGLTDQFSYTIQGNDITLTGPITGAGIDEYGQLRLEIGLTLGANMTIAGMNQVYLDPPASFDLGVYDLTLQGSANLFNLSGTGNIIVDGGTVSISGDTASSYSGDITVTAGSLSVYLPTAVESVNSVVVSGSGQITLAPGIYGIPLTLGGTGSACFGPDDCVISASGFTDNEVTLSGGLTLTSDITLVTDGTLIVQDPFTDNGHTIKVGAGGSGTLVLPSGEVVEPVKETITITDTTTAAVNAWNNQTVILNGERSSAYVYSGGTLKGTGTVTGTVNVAEGGTIAPGLSPGCLSTGNLTISGSYEFEIDGNTVCTEYDQIDVTGSVDVTGATLDLARGTAFVPALNDEFVLINNDASDTITGEFSGWAQGAQVVVDQVTYEIDYAGGDGNDVVLTVVAIDSALVEEADAPDTGLQSVLANPLVGISALVLSGATLAALRQKKLI